MSSSRLSGVLAAVLAASTLASCGESVLESAREGERRAVLEQAHKDARQHADKDKAGRKAEHNADDEAESARQHGGQAEPRSRAGTTGLSNTAGPVGDTGPEGQGDRQKQSYQRRGPGPAGPAESCAEDMSGDMEGAGSIPAYADLRRGCLREEGGQLTLAATSVGALPSRMPGDDTNLAIGFELTPPSGDSIYVAAESTADGWSAYLSEDGSSRRIAAPRINGDQLVLAIPASGLGNAERIAWSVESSWLRSTLTTTEYAFDDAPNGSVASFDRG